MDAVYILGTGSRSGNEEIRYSVRSLEKHMSDLGKVFVVGSRPESLRAAAWIEATDNHAKYWKNALEKTRFACFDERVSADFLLMNDDFFMREDFIGAELPFYSVKGGSGGGSGLHDFGIHCPIRFNKEMYVKMPLSTELKGDFSPRSFYANFYKARPEPVKDCIVRTGSGLPDYGVQVKGSDFFSCDDVAFLVPSFQDWMRELYPLPSRCER